MIKYGYVQQAVQSQPRNREIKGKVMGKKKKKKKKKNIGPKKIRQ